MAEGSYEVLVEKALEDAGPAPWNVHDLDRVKTGLTQEFCSAVQADCDRDAILDWLNALPPEAVVDLLDRLNAGREKDG
jgi:hypothetical protein